MANDNIFSTVMNGAGDWFAKKLASYMPVSYTHLTLPTNREV